MIFHRDSSIKWFSYPVISRHRTDITWNVLKGMLKVFTSYTCINTVNIRDTKTSQNEWLIHTINTIAEQKHCKVNSTGNNIKMFWFLFTLVYLFSCVKCFFKAFEVILGPVLFRIWTYWKGFFTNVCQYRPTLVFPGETLHLIIIKS